MDDEAACLDFSSIPGLSSDDAAKDVAWILQQIANAGFRYAIVADYSVPSIKPIRVVRAIIPGLETINPFHTGVSAEKRSSQIYFLPTDCQTTRLGVLITLREGLKDLQYLRFRDQFQGPVSMDVPVGREAKSPSPWLRWSKDSHTRNQVQIGAMKHARVNSQKQIALSN